MSTDAAEHPVAPALVLRELPESLLRELRQGRRTPAPQGPLMRALMRAEAELLVADALAMEVGTYVPRGPDDRRAEAVELVRSRLRLWAQDEAVRETVGVARAFGQRPEPRSSQRASSAARSAAVSASVQP